MKFCSIIFLVSTFFAITHGNINALKDADEELKYLHNYVYTLSRQVMLQQFFAEERVRSEGQSGLVLLRQRGTGTKNYFVETHTGYATAAIHDHSNNIRTVGMGEFTAVLNGIQFTTRHNDYSLRMPHRTSGTYHDTEEIPFPDVPPEVLSKKSIQEQIDEMREWFKAWRDQNDTVRDYKKYFKPVLCYLEGAWTTTGVEIDEPFTSDRHFLDAATWMELHEKSEFLAYTGSKSRLENLSFLPTKIIGFVNETLPVFAQWNYRILCHPIQRDIPLNRLRVVDDISSRMMTGNTIYKYIHSRAARFQFNTEDSEIFTDRPISDRSFLDKIMEEIPGKDNYQGHHTDEGLDTPVLNDDETLKDVSRYHRWYKVGGKDAMGTVKIHRGYSDDFLFAAMNEQPKIAGVNIRKCKNKRKPNTCYNLHQKWSYAIPLELIFLTPLYKWNPYDLKYHGIANEFTEKIVKDSGYSRTGACQPGKEYNGTNSQTYYVTPSEFYVGGKIGSSSADTARGSSCILDQNGVSRMVRASGTHIFLPSIKDVGVLRTRYPIFPVHDEGSSAYKELNGLKEIVMNNLEHMKWSKEAMKKDTDNIELTMGISHSAHTTGHTHDIELSASEISQLKGGLDVYKTTTLANGHQHILKIRWSTKDQHYYYDRCDNNQLKCWDGHDKVFQVDKIDEEATV